MTKLFVKGQLLAHKLRHDVKGVSTIEYAVLAFGIIAALVGLVTILSGGFNTMFGNLNAKIGAIS